MKSRTKLLTAGILIIAILLNMYIYISFINEPNIVLSLLKRINYAYITPKTYLNAANRFQKKPQAENHAAKQLKEIILEKSNEFIRAGFEGSSARMKQLLDTSAKYIRSVDGSSFIRYVENGVHVEGYMATDKKLAKTKQRWIIREKDQTITCCMEIYIEGKQAPELWYIHFRKVKDDWKIYMLENDI